MSGSLGGTDAGLAVTAGLVGDGELSEVAADHVEPDLDVVEALTVVDGDVVADHFGHDDGVAEVSLDGGGLLSDDAVLLGLLALGVEPDVFMLDLCIKYALLLENRRRIRVRKCSTNCSWVSSFTWSGVSPRKLYLFSPFSLFGAVDILWSIIFN